MVLRVFVLVPSAVLRGRINPAQFERVSVGGAGVLAKRVPVLLVGLQMLGGGGPVKVVTVSMCSCPPP